jgi:hypothetical protein
MVRSFIHLLVANSRWPVASLQATLDKEIYADRNSWHKFIKGLILSLGLGFFVAGVVFFFAFNWEQLHRFAKLGLVQAVFLVLAGLAWVLRKSVLLHRLLLTAAAVMIGVIFAVFGQIYQTGANAYDFFFFLVDLCIDLVSLSGFRAHVVAPDHARQYYFIHVHGAGDQLPFRPSCLYCFYTVEFCLLHHCSSFA